MLVCLFFRTFSNKDSTFCPLLMVRRSLKACRMKTSTEVSLQQGSSTQACNAVIRLSIYSLKLWKRNNKLRPEYTETCRMSKIKKKKNTQIYSLNSSKTTENVNLNCNKNRATLFLSRKNLSEMIYL